jgi:predicted Ser/Thr protein kinase
MRVSMDGGGVAVWRMVVLVLLVCGRSATTMTSSSLASQVGEFAMARYATGVGPREEGRLREGLEDECEEVVVQRLQKSGKELRICREPWNTEGSQAVVFKGELEGEMVVIKFYRRYSKIGGTMERELYYAERVSDLPMFPSLLGRVDQTDFESLAEGGVNLRRLVAPGAIFEFVEGDSLGERLDMKRMEGEENSSGWIGCVASQTILAHLMAMSRGVFHTDMYPQNILLEYGRIFWLGDERCESIRVVDFGLSERVFAADIPAKIFEAVTNLDEIYGRQTVSAGMVEFMQEVLKIDPVIKKHLISELADYATYDTSVQNSWGLELLNALKYN